MAFFEIGNDEIDAVLATLQSPTFRHDEQQPTATASPFRTTKVAKSKHKQFSRFEVILLVFDSPQTIIDYLKQNDAPIAGELIELHSHQLVAVCLAGDEEVSLLNRKWPSVLRSPF